MLLTMSAGREDLKPAVAEVRAILHPGQRRAPGDLPAALK